MPDEKEAISIWCLVELMLSDFDSSIRPATSVIVNLPPEDVKVLVSMVKDELAGLG